MPTHQTDSLQAAAARFSARIHRKIAARPAQAIAMEAAGLATVAVDRVGAKAAADLIVARLREAGTAVTKDLVLEALSAAAGARSWDAWSARLPEGRVALADQPVKAAAPGRNGGVQPDFTFTPERIRPLAGQRGQVAGVPLSGWIRTRDGDLSGSMSHRIEDENIQARARMAEAMMKLDGHGGTDPAAALAQARSANLMVNDKTDAVVEIDYDRLDELPSRKDVVAVVEQAHEYGRVVIVDESSAVDKPRSGPRG